MRFGAGLAAALVVVSGAYGAGLASRGDRAASPTVRVTVTPTSGAPASAASPSPTATAPIATTPTDTAGIAGTPARINSVGVPVGYPHTRAGAVSACANYTDAYGNVANHAPARLAAVIASVALPDKAAGITAALGLDDRTNAYLYGVDAVTSTRFDQQFRVVGYRTQSYAPDAASVLVWSTLGLGRVGATDENAPREFWSTQQCSVRWQDGDWRLAAASQARSGPAVTDPDAATFSRFVYVGG